MIGLLEFAADTVAGPAAIQEGQRQEDADGQVGRAGAAATQISQASNVPQVPEAGRIRPLPRPKAISRPGSRQTQDSEG